MALGVVLFFLIMELAFRRSLGKRRELDDYIKKILNDSKKGKLNYSRLFQVIQLLKKDNPLLSMIGPREILNNSNLELDSKTYFTNLLDNLENNAFSQVGVKKRFKYERKCFKDLKKNLLTL